jgi:dolichol-phosphate mannosyltransferase
MEKGFDDSEIVIVLATKNEEGGVGPTIEEIRQVLRNAHLLVVDGHSTDKTVMIAKDLGANIIIQDGKGKGQAIGQCMKQMDPKCKYVVFIDADFTYPAAYIPQMIEILEQNPDVGMVIGNRFGKDVNFGLVSSNVFYIGNRFLALAQHLVNGIDLQDPLSGLRVLRSELITRWEPKSQHFDVEAEMNYFVERKGYGIEEIPIEYRTRLGEKKLKLRHGVMILRRILSESLISQ